MLDNFKFTLNFQDKSGLLAIIILMLLGFIIQASGVILGFPMDGALKVSSLLSDPLTNSYRFITSIFMHAGLLHLAMNGMFIVVAGQVFFVFARRFLNIQHPSLYFVLLFLWCGIGGGIVFVLTAILSHNSDISAVGASGSAFGLLGYLIVVVPPILRRTNYPGMDELKREIVGLLAINLIFGLVVPAVALSAHIGGLIFGMVAGYIRKIKAEKFLDGKLLNQQP